MYRGELFGTQDKSVNVIAFETIGNGKYKWHTKEDIYDYTIYDYVKNKIK